MEEYKSEIEVLLDSLDKSVNSNTAWLHFSINSTQDFNLKIFLLNQLRTGHFHFTLVQSDINRGWEHFVSLIYSKNWKDTLIMLQKPGNSWNENENLTIEEISYEQAKNYIVDLLTGEQIHFTKSPLGTTINNIYAREIFNNFITHIAGIKKKQVTFYNIKPDFLWTVEDYFKSDYTKQGYFETSGRDFVLAILLYESEMDSMELNILMTNGYC